MTVFAGLGNGRLEVDDPFTGDDPTVLTDKGVTTRTRQRENFNYELITQTFPVGGESPPLADGELIDTANFAEYLEVCFDGIMADGVRTLHLLRPDENGGFGHNIDTDIDPIGSFVVTLPTLITPDQFPMFSVELQGVEQVPAGPGVNELTWRTFWSALSNSHVVIGEWSFDPGFEFTLRIFAFHWEL